MAARSQKRWVLRRWLVLAFAALGSVGLVSSSVVGCAGATDKSAPPQRPKKVVKDAGAPRDFANSDAGEPQMLPDAMARDAGADARAACESVTERFNIVIGCI